MRTLIVSLVLASVCLADDVLVFAPKEFHGAIAAWKTHREKQGHKVVVAEPVKDLRAAIAAAKPKFVLLVGDVKQIPARIYQAKIIQKWEKDPRIHSDNHVADLDGDHVPDVAIGRIPADTAEEAALMLGKVVAYENDKDFGMWRRRINVVAGVGGFGVQEDAAIEQASTSFLKQSIPASYDLHVSYCKPSSPYCPPPSQVMEITTERFNEGALFFAYIGHGWRNGFDRVKFKGISHRIFTEDAAAALASRAGMPIAFLLCCSTGHFDGSPDCISEVMVKTKTGPVAVVSSSRVSMPYGNAPLAKELLEAVFKDQVPTLGEALLRAKVRAAADGKDAQRKEIEFLAKVAYERDDEKRRLERIEHLYLYNLLGDPCMRLPHASKAKVTADVVAGQLKVSVKSDVDGAIRVEVVKERSPLRNPRRGDTDEAFMRAYEAANKNEVLILTGDTRDGAFTTNAMLPNNLRAGRYDVRVWIVGEKAAAMGTTQIRVNAD